MILGTGIDIVEIERIKSVESIDRFIERILHPEEQEIYQTFTHEGRKLAFLAGRFAAKEAYSKALGSGIGPIRFHEIIILNDAKGKPYIKKKRNAFVSISHSEHFAVAMVIIEGPPPPSYY